MASNEGTIYESSDREKQALKDGNHTILPPFQTIADLVEVCEQAGVDPKTVKVVGKYHARTDNQSGLLLVKEKENG
jgi:hypothetical protein